MVRRIGPDWTGRPSRWMPSMTRVVRFWGIQSWEPFCVRCGLFAPVKNWKESGGYLCRAHMIDRGFGGVDSECNLAPLCGTCHRRQPIFVPGDEAYACEWFGLPLDYRQREKTLSVMSRQCITRRTLQFVQGRYRYKPYPIVDFETGRVMI